MFNVYVYLRKYGIAFLFLILIPITNSATHLYTPLPQKISVRNSLLNFSKQIGFTGRLNEASCTGENDNTICVAVGFADFSSQYPLLMQSNDAGISFTIQNQITNFTNKGTLLSTNCVGSGNTALCVAGGYLGDSKETGKPYLVQSSDGGISWSQVTISGSMNYGLIKKVSCTGNPPIAKCIAVGSGNQDNSASSYPLLVQTLDNGNTWSSKLINKLSPLAKGQLYSASCTGVGINAMCIAVGDYEPYSSIIPLLIQTSDGGNTWVNTEYLFLSPLDLSLKFTDVSCTGGSYHAICTIAGRIGSEDPLFNPIIYQTKDRGVTWLKTSLDNFPTNWNGTLHSISCTGNVRHPICASVGVGSFKPNLLKGSNFPLIVQNNEDKWSISSITNAASDWNTLYSASCINGSNPFCFAVGFALNNNNIPSPILTIKTDAANTWQAITINNMPNEGVLRNGACNESGSTCVAVGFRKNIEDQPLIIVSKDHGKTWDYKPKIDCPPPKEAPDATVICDNMGEKCIATAHLWLIAGWTWLAYYTENHCSWNLAKDATTDFADWKASKCSNDFSTCIIVGTSWPVPLILSSFDSGQSWMHQTFSNPSDGKCKVNDIIGSVSFFKSIDSTDVKGNDWVAVGQCGWNLDGKKATGLSMISKDRGKSWTLSDTQPNLELNNVICNYSKNCIAYSDNTRYQSLDGGNTWHQIS